MYLCMHFSYQINPIHTGRVKRKSNGYTREIVSLFYSNLNLIWINKSDIKGCKIWFKGATWLRLKYKCQFVVVSWSVPYTLIASFIEVLTLSYLSIFNFSYTVKETRHLVSLAVIFIENLKNCSFFFHSYIL